MVLALHYWSLSNTVSETSKLANELGQYCDELSRKVQQKMYSVDGGMSGALNNVDYYVNRKIQQLRTHESNARNIAAKTQVLIETAKRVDEDVARTINENQRVFFVEHPELKAPWYKLALTSFFCDMKNVPVLGWLIRVGEQVVSAIEKLKGEIKYWYKCEGGKELVGIVLSVVGAILATVVFVCAFVITGGTIWAIIVGIAGVISATIGLLDAGTNIVTSIQAYNAAKDGEPGMAKIYAGQDKLSDVLRQTNFHNKELNRKSNGLATRLEITDAVCSIITLVSDIGNTYGDIKKMDVKKVFQSICQPRDQAGRFVAGKPSFWNGIKSITMKFNVKDFVLGDLNVKNLSRLSKLTERKDRWRAIGSFAKAAKGIINDFDKINEGKQSFGDFIAKRVVIGLDTTFLKQQELNTKKEKVEVGGVMQMKDIRKYRDTNFAQIVKAARLPIDGLGIGKLLSDKTIGASFSNIANLKGGGIKNVTDIIKQINVWKVPEVIFSEEERL